MTITNQTTIQELLDQGLMTQDQWTKLQTRSARMAAREESRQLVQGTADAIMAFLSSEVQAEAKYFSVKKTSNSVGFMDFIETDRATVLKALTQLVSEDKIRKIGLVGGEEKPVAAVNAFQIRYTRA